MEPPQMGASDSPGSGLHEELEYAGRNCQAETGPHWVSWGVDEVLYDS
jgi:hypothetical protein